MSNSAPPSNLTGAKLGNYRLERLLGRGRMGMVYLAHDEALLRPVAVKLLAWTLPDAQHHDPEAWLLQEARNIARVSHPAVIQIYGVARHGSHAYIAMEYVDGVSADRFVAERGPFSASAATQIVLQIAGALQAAHEGGVIHRDVKPANILIRTDGSAKLGDFGMAIHRQNPSTAALEQQVGTPLYTAPELWNGAPAGPATDVYALGATYYFLLTGRAPFEAEDLPALIEAHRRKEPALLDQLAARLPEECVALVRRCLAKSPQERPASAQELSWLARAALRSTETFRQGNARRLSPARLPAVQVEIKQESVHEALGLTHSPFAALSGDAALASVPSFERAVAALRELLDEPGGMLQLSATPGPSATSLLEAMLRATGKRPNVGWVEASGATAGPGALALRACRAFGAVPSTEVATSNAVEGLIEHLAGGALEGAAPPLLVIEVPSPRLLASELELLAQAAELTRYFSIVALACDRIAMLPDEAVLPAPALSVSELFAMLRTHLQNARAPGAAPLLVTPDAAILLRHETQGDLGRLAQLGGRVLWLMRQSSARVITSRHVWLAARDREAADTATNWPPPEVLALLNAERQLLGFEAREGAESNPVQAAEPASALFP